MRLGRGSPTPTPGQGEDALPSVLAPALRRFVAYTLLATLLLVAASVVVADRIAREHALDDAERQGVGLATRIAAPLVDAGVRAGGPGAADQLTTVMDNRMRDGSVQHVKIWNEDGQVIWSDQKEVVGRTFPLPADVSALFTEPGATAELSELDREENVAEAGEGPMLEVYVGTTDADGEPLVVEAYLAAEPMEANARTVLIAFVPVIAGATVLLMLVVVPLAVGLSRRVERAQRDRARLMRHAVLASDLERRRIARGLHDGVVQELAGVGYTLPVVNRELRPGGDLEHARTTLERITELVQRNVLALRQVMTDIYPPDLDGHGLRDAVEQLVMTEAARVGVTCRVRVAEDLELPVAPARLAYRIVREAVHNVVKHADATQIDVSLDRTHDLVLVRVVDDGRGCPAGALPLRTEEGHLGLKLLVDTVRDVGGRLEATSPGPGLGVAVVAEFPVVLRGL